SFQARALLASGPARNRRRSARRPAARRDGFGRSRHHRDATGRQASDAGPRVSVRASARSRRSLRPISMIAAARVAAFDVLEAVSSGRADLPTALAHARGRLSDNRDRALCAEIATGVERHRAALDYLIATFARRRIERLDAEVLAVLRLSAYQL